MYRCKKCGLAVIVHEGKIYRACNCNTTVILSVSAQAKGVGGVKA